jgi:hypothetical protein
LKKKLITTSFTHVSGARDWRSCLYKKRQAIGERKIDYGIYNPANVREFTMKKYRWFFGFIKPYVERIKQGGLRIFGRWERIEAKAHLEQ